MNYDVFDDDSVFQCLEATVIAFVIMRRILKTNTGFISDFIV